MPTLQRIEKDIKSLQKQLKINIPTADEEFDVKDTVTYPIASDSDKFWRSIRIQLYGFMYKVGDEKDTDEPEFITTSQRDKDIKVVHVPQGKAEPPEVKALQKRYPRKPVLVYNALDDTNTHEIAVSCAAFDSDADSGWQRFVDALGEDLDNVGSTLIDTITPGLISPGGLLDFIGDKLKSLLTDDPEVIGSEEIITDVRHEWKRPADKISWSAYKWVVFRRDNQEAWYLTLWRIDLDSRPIEYTLASTRIPGDSSIGINDVAVAMRPDRHAAAAVRLLSGDQPDAVASTFNLSPAELQVALRQFLATDLDTLNERIRGAMLSELVSLRSELNVLQSRRDNLD